MRRCRVEIKEILLDVFAVIPFIAGQTKGALFQDRIAPVPERDCKTNHLMTIANAGETRFIPTIGSRARVGMWKIFPGATVRAVVLTHCAPGTFAEVGSPALPVPGALARFFQTFFFG